MSCIVGVHGIGQQSKSPDMLHAEWYPALCQGIVGAGHAQPCPTFLRCAFYGDLFRASRTKSLGQEWELDDLTDPWEQEFVALLEGEAARVLGEDPEKRVKFLKIPSTTQAGFRFLLRVPGFGRLSESTVIKWFVKEAYRYMNDQALREAARQRIMDAIACDTRIVIAHSLGTVVTYEALALSGRKIDLLITAGSPLGIPKLFFDKLHPELEATSRRLWPPGVRRWINLSQPKDVVCLRKSLRSIFHRDEAEIEDHLLADPAGLFNAHDAENYLSAAPLVAAVSSIVGVSNT